MLLIHTYQKTIMTTKSQKIREAVSACSPEEMDTIRAEFFGTSVEKYKEHITAGHEFLEIGNFRNYKKKGVSHFEFLDEEDELDAVFNFRRFDQDFKIMEEKLFPTPKYIPVEPYIPKHIDELEEFTFENYKKILSHPVNSCGCFGDDGMYGSKKTFDSSDPDRPLDTSVFDNDDLPEDIVGRIDLCNTKPYWVDRVLYGGVNNCMGTLNITHYPDIVLSLLVISGKKPPKWMLKYCSKEFLEHAGLN